MELSKQPRSNSKPNGEPRVQTTMRLRTSLKERLEALARIENRSVANLVEQIAENELRRHKL